MIQHLLERRQGGWVGDLEGATDAGGFGQGGQAPGGRDRRVATERSGAVTEIAEILVAGQDAQQHGQELVGGGVLDRLLGDRQGGKLGGECEGLGQMAPGDEQGMVGGLAYGRPGIKGEHGAPP